MTDSALSAALAPPRAYAESPARAQVRAEPEDFVVEEELGFAPSGQGQHVLLRVRKRNANTQWVARELARHAGCRAADVGYAGLKDRRAVAVQWFTVPQPRTALSWPEVRSTEFEVLESHPHHRKLPRGALAGNRFELRLRPPDADAARLAAALAPRLAQLRERGVPNYFGPQRFGRDGANLSRHPETLPPAQRAFALSAARAALFNAVLGARVGEGSWERLEAGDLANLDGRGSVFAVDLVDAQLAERCRRLEVHPSGPLWGGGQPASTGRVLALETGIAAQLPEPAAVCAAAGMRQERRSLRLAVRDLSCEVQEPAVRLTFRLPRGAFATAVLRELLAPSASSELDLPQPADSST